MKRTLSTKFKLTLWFTGFLAVLAAVCLGLILVINSHVARTEAFNILSLTVRGNIPNVSADQDRLVLKPEFEFYSNNVYMLIYNKNKALISGQAPPSFPVDAALENGVTKFVPDGESGFYVLDFWIPSGWLRTRIFRLLFSRPGPDSAPILTTTRWENVKLAERACFPDSLTIFMRSSMSAPSVGAELPLAGQDHARHT